MELKMKDWFSLMFKEDRAPFTHADGTDDYPEWEKVTLCWTDESSIDLEQEKEGDASSKKPASALSQIKSAIREKGGMPPYKIFFERSWGISKDRTSSKTFYWDEVKDIISGDFFRIKEASEKETVQRSANERKLRHIFSEWNFSIEEGEEIIFHWTGPDWGSRKKEVAVSAFVFEARGMVEELGEPQWVSFRNFDEPIRWIRWNYGNLSFKEKQRLTKMVGEAKKYSLMAKEAPSEEEERAFYKKKDRAILGIVKSFPYNVEFPYYIESQNSYYGLYEIKVKIGKKIIFCGHSPSEVVGGWDIEIHPARKISRDDWEANRLRREELLRETDSL